MVEANIGWLTPKISLLQLLLNRARPSPPVQRSVPFCNRDSVSYPPSAPWCYVPKWFSQMNISFTYTVGRIATVSILLRPFLQLRRSPAPCVLVTSFPRTCAVLPGRDGPRRTYLDGGRAGAASSYSERTDITNRFRAAGASFRLDGLLDADTWSINHGHTYKNHITLPNVLPTACLRTTGSRRPHLDIPWTFVWKCE